MKIVVSGSTGLVGSALQPVLVRAGHDVVPLVRRPPAPGERAIQWNPARGTIDRAGLEGADAVIHLAGENVFGRGAARPAIRAPPADGRRDAGEREAAAALLPPAGETCWGGAPPAKKNRIRD